MGNRLPGRAANICWVISQLMDQPGEEQRAAGVPDQSQKTSNQKSRAKIHQSAAPMTHGLSQIIKPPKVCLRYRWGCFAPSSGESRHWAVHGGVGGGGIIGCIWEEVNERI